MPATTPLITTLIDKIDVSEMVRDQIGAILLLETTKQQELAAAAVRDPALWAFRVFTERTNPWGEFMDLPDGDLISDDPTIDLTPIVNVWWDGITFDRSASNVVERQKGTSTFNVDIYTVGVSRATLEGHQPGDELARLEMARVVRLVRNILMAAQYTYLALRGTVWGRWIASIETFEPPSEIRAAQRIGAARIALQVDHNEFSPQVPTVPLEGVTVFVERGETGQLYFTQAFDFSPTETP